MMGAVQNPRLMPADELLRAIARERGIEDKFSPTDVSVFFGEPGKTVPDPYFGGAGPERAGCIFCGGCMTGCRHNAKNTLDKNYLYLAREKGLQLHADTCATWVRPLPQGGYEVSARQGASLWRTKERRFAAHNVIFAGGVLGTLSLLLKLKGSEAGLPRLSPRLGHTVRTNSESLIAVTNGRRDQDHSRGVAIGSIVETDPWSHLEPVRHASGNGFFRALLLPHVPGDAPAPIKLVQAFLTALRRPVRTLRTALVWNWAKHTIFLLYMRTLEGTLQLRRRDRGWARLNGSMATSIEQGEPPRASIPEASELAEDWARRQGGIPFSGFTETLFNIPSTAHILGGCCMGDSPETGVIDARHRVFGYEGLYVVDGSAISANPGVNPSLTILALAERAISYIEAKGTVISS
jgi:cholesterol oxidase